MVGSDNRPCITACYLGRRQAVRKSLITAYCTWIVQVRNVSRRVAARWCLEMLRLSVRSNFRQHVRIWRETPNHHRDVFKVASNEREREIWPSTALAAYASGETHVASWNSTDAFGCLHRYSPAHCAACLLQVSSSVWPRDSEHSFQESVA